MTVDVELSSDPTDPDRTIVGFVPFDTRTVELPFDVSIDTAAVGGPSAGAAFTLALIDELTPGDLTGGRDIAVTGHDPPRRVDRPDRGIGAEGRAPCTSTASRCS